MRQVSIRRSLLANMLLLVALLGAAVLATTVIGANGMAEQLSRTLIGQTIDRTESQVRHFIAPVEDALDLIGRWVADGAVNPVDGTGADRLLLPVLASQEALFGSVLVDPQGRVLSLQRHQHDWRLRLMDPDRPGTARVRFPLGDPQWRTEDYQLDVTVRPWYAAALRAEGPAPGWTQAYRFFQTGQPGISAATRVTGPDGGQWVLALDVLLEDISDFSRELRVGHQGMILITDGLGQIIGLPNLPRFESASARQAAYLQHPRELGFSLSADAARAFQPDASGSVALEPVRFRSDGRVWWGQGKWIPLDNATELWVGVLVPESELLATIQQLRILIITVTALVTLLAIVRTIGLARRYSQPISALADQSLRISRGDLEEPVAVRSRLSELLNLAEAQERMRQGLVSLLRLEDDLQLARQIQQKTFPVQFPRCREFDIGAESRPAAATGGDTYDVVGVRYDRASGAVAVTESAPEQIYLLLADATGHGIGPALTASQVRAMFRMGVRLGSPPDEIAVHMNEQLLEDAHGGRFVTAWLARLDTRNRRLCMLSAGQAPIIVYRAATAGFERLDADRPPFGVVRADDHPTLREIDLREGDVVAVFSDGVLEARSPVDDEPFGVERVEAIMRDHLHRPASALIAAVRAAIERHTDGEPPDDDQTAIVIRRR